MNGAGRMAAAFLVLLAALCAAAGAAAQDIWQVVARGGVHDDYVRIVMEWPTATDFEATVEGRELRVRFERPFRADYGDVLKALFRRLEAAETAADDRVAVFRFARPVTLRAERIDNLVVLDLRDAPEPEPEPAAATPPAAATAVGAARPAARNLAAAAPVTVPAGAPEVGVRAGEHPTYGRVVFDWTGPVGYRIEEAAGEVAVAFDRPARFAFGPARRRLPPQVGQIDQVAAADGSRVRLTVAEGARVRHFLADSKVVVDILQADGRAAPRPQPAAEAQATPGAAPAAVAASAPAADRSPAAAAALPAIPKPPRPTETNDEWTERALQRVRDAVAQLQAATAPGPGSGPDMPGPPTGPAGDPAAASPAEAPPAVPAGPRVGPDGTPAPATAPKLDLDLAAAPVPLPVAAAPDPAAAIPPPPVAVAASRPAPTAGPVGRVTARLRSSDDGLAIAFAWPQPVRAAAFERAGRIWVVFDRPAELATDALRAAADRLAEVRQIDSRLAAVLQLRPHGTLFPRLEQDGDGWLLRLSEGAGGATAPIRASAQADGPQGAQLFLPVLQAGEPVRLFDTEVGDELVVVPVGTQGAGLSLRQDYVDLSLLPSAQGVVVAPTGTDVIVVADQTGVSIRGPGGLALSPPGLRRLASDALGGEPGARRDLLPFGDWYESEPGRFLERQHNLQRDLAAAPEAERNRARIELAALHLAHGRAPDALALLAIAQEKDADVLRRPEVRALNGIAHLLMGRPAQAGDLLHADLDRYPDIRLWRGMLLGEQARYDDAVRAFGAGFGSLPALPQRLREAMYGAWARAAIGARDLDSFGAAAEALEKMAADGAAGPQLTLLRGRAAEVAGRDTDAIALYRQVAAGRDRESRARAELALTDLELKAGTLPVEAAVAQLQRLRFAWRGDDFEPSVLRRLAARHADAGQFREALIVLRQAVALVPKGTQALAETEAMEKLFSDLFLQGHTDGMGPLQALALYYEFQELTPSGGKGDRIIRQLAERLAEVDLLDRSAMLLEQQIQNRLVGTERAATATRLAEIRLQDGDPAAALAALDMASEAGLPAHLLTARRLTAARALGRLGQPQQALTALATESGLAAERLRGDLAWTMQDWALAAASLNVLLEGRWRADRMEEAERRQVVRLAVASYMAGDRTGVDSVEQRFAGLLEGTPEAAVLTMLKNGEAAAGADPRERAAAIAGIPGLEAFMASLKAGG